jgi:hypothetical protein
MSRGSCRTGICQLNLISGSNGILGDEESISSYELDCCIWNAGMVGHGQRRLEKQANDT